MNTVYVTGANGFIGKAVCKIFAMNNWQVKAGIRCNRELSSFGKNIIPVISPSLGANVNWSFILSGVHTIVHLAARVHIMKESTNDPMEEFRMVNRFGTECLAHHAATAGVKRFIFLSTIGVNGNSSKNKSFTESDDPQPHNPYSISKFEAENFLREINDNTSMDVVILRAPLVYGPGNPGNFLDLLYKVDMGIPFPFASIQNMKSFIYVENLADALYRCAIHPKAVGNTFLVSDDVYISTSELIQHISIALCKPVKLFHFPLFLIRLFGKLVGKTNAVNSLLDSLSLDINKIKHDLEWKPPFTMEEGLAETAKWFKGQL